MKDKVILIFGVSSFVGSNLAEYLKEDFKVVGTYYSRPIRMPGVLTLQCDVLNRDVVQMIFFAIKPDITIYCVGMTSIVECHEREKLATHLNALGVYNVATFTERYKSKLCYISSGFIFPGSKKEYSEAHIPDPNTVYGRTKADAEFFIQKSCLNYLIFRCSFLYGRGSNFERQTWFEWMQNRILFDERVSCDGHISSGFIDVLYLAALFKLAIKEEISNRLFQISSKEIMTVYDFAKCYAQAFKTNENLVQKGHWGFKEKRSEFSNEEGGGAAGRHYNLLTDTIENFFNISMPTVMESLRFTYLRFGGKMSDKSGGSRGNEIKFI